MTALEFQTKAIEETGGFTTNAIFEIAFMGVTNGGAFPINVNGATTAPLPFGISALSMQVALCGLVTVGAGGVVVTGPKGGPYELEFGGENAGQSVPRPIVDGSALIPVQAVQVTQLQEGEINDLAARAARLWDGITDSISTKHRFLLLKLELIDYRLGVNVDATDQRTGQVNITERKENQRYTNLLAMRNLVMNAISAEISFSQGGRNRSFGGKIRTRTPNDLPYGMMRRNPRTGRPE